MLCRQSVISGEHRQLKTSTNVFVFVTKSRFNSVVNTTLIHSLFVNVRMLTYVSALFFEFSYIDKEYFIVPKNNILTMSPISPVSMTFETENREKFKRNILLG